MESKSSSQQSKIFRFTLPPAKIEAAVHDLNPKEHTTQASAQARSTPCQPLRSAPGPPHGAPQVAVGLLLEAALQEPHIEDEHRRGGDQNFFFPDCCERSGGLGVEPRSLSAFWPPKRSFEGPRNSESLVGLSLREPAKCCPTWQW